MVPLSLFISISFFPCLYIITVSLLSPSLFPFSTIAPLNFSFYCIIPLSIIPSLQSLLLMPLCLPSITLINQTIPLGAQACPLRTLSGDLWWSWPVPFKIRDERGVRCWVDPSPVRGGVGHLGWPDFSHCDQGKGAGGGQYLGQRYRTNNAKFLYDTDCWH